MKKIAFYLTACLLLGCTTDSYDKGEGELSLTQADLADLSVDSRKQAVAFTTDDGTTYQLQQPATASWIETADTTYRVMLYYNKLDDTQAEAVAAGMIPTLLPVEHWRYKELPQDPIGMESAWLAGNRKYLNLGLLMRTGRISDEELPHNIGLAQDTVMQHADGRQTAYYRLLHSQNGIPAYYTNRRFVSILLPDPKPDTICLSLQTFSGVVQRTFTP